MMLIIAKILPFSNSIMMAQKFRDLHALKIARFSYSVPVNLPNKVVKVVLLKTRMTKSTHQKMFQMVSFTTTKAMMGSGLR